MRRLALFGGSFDPIHNGHLALSRAALESGRCDRIIFLPSGISPHKGALCASGEDRLAMVRLAIEHEERFDVSTFEIDKKTPCYTYDTVCAFRSLYKKDALFFLIGDDEYRLFDSWYRKDELLSLCTFLVFTRDGGAVKKPFVPVLMPRVTVSSSDVRRIVQKGGDVSALVPPSVARYMKEHGLYQ